MAASTQAGRNAPVEFYRPCYFSETATYGEGIVVCYTTTKDYVIKPTYAGMEPAGVVMKDYTGPRWGQIQTKGKAICIASEALNLHDYVSAGNTSGYVHKALPGEPLVGRTVQEAAGSGSDVEVELMIGSFYIREWQYSNTAMTADTAIVTGLSAGNYKVADLRVTETAGNAVTGGFDIGTTASGEEIASTLTVAGSTAYDYSAGSNFVSADGVFTLTAGDSIYFSAHTAWNDASLKVSFKLELAW